MTLREGLHSDDSIDTNGLLQPLYIRGTVKQGGEYPDKALWW